MKSKDIKAVKSKLLSYKIQTAKLTMAYESISQKIHDSEEIANFLFDNWEPDTIGCTESFYIVLLNRANGIKGIVKHSSGGVAGTVCDMKSLFCSALLSLSSSIILAHNHPSGNLKPSDQDMALTTRVVQAAKLLEIAVLDHIILTPDKGRFYSLGDNGHI